MRGCKLNSLTPSNDGTTAPIFYNTKLRIVSMIFSNCYKIINTN